MMPFHASAVEAKTSGAAINLGSLRLAQSSLGSVGHLRQDLRHQVYSMGWSLKIWEVKINVVQV